MLVKIFLVQLNGKLLFQFLMCVLLTGRAGIIPSRCVCNSKGKETAYSKLVFSVPPCSSEENLN
jgi:hypothetical protein